jgi:outer membrane protein
MKSCRIVLISFLSFFFVNLNAQVFVGGDFGLSTSGGSTDDGTTSTDKNSTFNYNFSPKIGKFLTEKVAVGLSLNLAHARTKYPGTTEEIDKTNTIGLSPFLRYYAIKLNKFSIFGQGNIGFSHSKATYDVGGKTSDGAKTTEIYFNIVPGLSYDISDKFSLETSINVLSFGYYHTTVKYGSEKDITSSFAMGAGLDDIVTLGDITIGAIYKF